MTGSSYADNESVRSRKTARSQGRYRAVARGSTVDESLFGETMSERTKKARSKGTRGSALRDSGARTVSTPSMLSMSRYDLMRMKEMSVIKTKEDLLREKQEKEKLDEIKYKKTRALKARMKALEDEAMKIRPMSEMERIKAAKDEEILKNAEEKRRETLDDVKTMNAMMQYAQCVTIRDMQVKEKAEREKAEQDHEKRLDIMMEINRLKLVKHYNDAEAERTANRIKDRSVITVQIDARKKKREEEKAALRREAEEMLVKMKKNAEAEEEVAKQHARKSKQLLMEVQADNQKQIEYRKKAKLAEIELDLKIEAYNKAKDEKARREEAEKEALAKSREMQIAKLRAMQEKTADKNAALDALRAKRAAQAAERVARKREEDEKNARKRAIEEMEFYRKKQSKEKEDKKLAEIVRERELFERNRAVRIDTMKKVRAKEEALKKKMLDQAAELRSTIEVNEKARAKARHDYLEAGKGWKEKVKEEMTRINEIKDMKVRELRARGVPDKYLTELGKYDPEKVLVQDYKRG